MPKSQVYSQCRLICEIPAFLLGSEQEYAPSLRGAYTSTKGVQMSVSTAVARRLLMESGGTCANPDCHRSLYDVVKCGEAASVYDLAHIIAKSVAGPRGAVPLSPEERDSYENTFLLCPNCHRLVDGNPDRFPVELLSQWKSDHVSAIRALFSDRGLSRSQLRDKIRPLMNENAAIHDQFGPESGHTVSLTGEAAKMWRESVLATVLPNNRRIYLLLSSNEEVLDPEEREAVKLFYSHLIGLEFNYLSGDKNPVAPTFPSEMNTILQEGVR